MTATAIQLVSRLLQFRPLSGAVFDKELRVASRRRRNYALRFAYIVLLTFFIAVIWIDVVRFRGSLTVQRAQMAVAAREITVGIVWFQFLAAQVVVLITMSTAISDEVHSRTLGALLTTPLSSRQVVMGKLLSRGAQILLLVATTLPLLAVVRVLGGIPWGFLLLSLFVTLVTVVFVGSVSLFFSALCRTAYAAVIGSALGVFFVFAFLPFLAAVLTGHDLDDREFMSAVSHVNPYALLYRYTEYMLSPRRSGAVSVGSLAACCVVLSVGVRYLLMASVRLVRYAALRDVTKPVLLLRHCRRDRGERGDVSDRPRRRERGIRRVIGPPMIWKELICTLSRRQKLAMALVVGIEVMLLFIAYTFVSVMAVIGYYQTHLLYVWAFLGLGILFTLSVSATVISGERESRAWSLLLVTPLRDRDLLLGKFVGVLRRCGPVWLPLLAYVVAFTYARCFHPLAVLQVVMLTVSVIVFLSATGFYFGSRCNRTAEAVTQNLVLAVVLWCVLPLMAHLVGIALHRWEDGELAAAVPFTQAMWMLSVTTESDAYIRWASHSVDAWQLTGLMVISMLVYLGAAQVFAWRAVRAFRRRLL